MKKIIALLAGLILFQVAFAQDETDALRYSYLTPGGTARMQAVGGAGISLGGDASNMDMNPAGIGLFKTNDFSFSPGFRTLNTQADYLGNSESDAKGNLDIQQFGLIFASNKRKKSNSRWENVTFGIGLNRLANFNRHIFYQGVNSSTSYSDNYLLKLQGETSYDNATKQYPFGVSQAVLTGLVGPEQDNNNQPTGNWFSIVPVTSGITQSNTISTKGGLNEYSFAVAGNYANKFYLGLSLNVPSIKYDRTKTFTETNTNDKDSPLDFYDVREKLHTDGAGINGKIGVIYAINPMVRIGGAFHSPSYFSMHDTYTTTLTNHTSDQGTLTSTTEDITGGYPGSYDYSLTTPWRAMGGISFIFGTSPDVSQQHGFLTLDYEFVNYASARYHFNSSSATASDKALANQLNSTISTLYKGASNLRVGGELKFDIVAVRAGVAWMGSPYANSDIDGDQMRYSAGVGIRNRGFYADLAYIYAIQKGINQPYIIADNNSGLHSPDPATLVGNASNIVLTIGFKL
jgi:hypothetical protein